MLSCGKVIGQLSKISRHTHGNHLQGPLKYVGTRNSVVCNFPTYDATFPLGIINIDSSRYKSTKDKKPYRFSGATLKAEECVPSAQKTEAKAPPPKIAGSACELGPTPACPPSCHDTCPGGNPLGATPPTDGDDKSPYKYWREILVALFLTGVAILTVSQLLPKKSEPTKKGKTGKKVIKKNGEEVEVKKSPVKSSFIPQHVPYLLIGGGPASFSAFRSIKSRDPKAKVLIITEEYYHPYMKPPLSKEVWYDKERKGATEFSFKQWQGTPRSFFYEPPEFFTKIDKLNSMENGGVSVASGWKVKKLDVNKKTAFLEDGYKITFDKCLIATGSKPKNIEVFEAAEDDVKSKILLYRTLDDFIALEASVNNPDVHNIVIIGGGFLGSELACSLAQNLDLDTKKVIQVYKEKFLMAEVLPEYLSEWTTNRVDELGVKCISKSEVEDFVMKDGKLFLILSGNEVIEADQVVVAVGAEANTDLADVSELEVDPSFGGYLVNSELEARSNVWVAGDAACFYDIKLGRRRVEHYDNAIISGRLAGDNMTGAGKPYRHQSMFWSDLGIEIGYEAIGIVDSTLPTVGVFLKDGKKEEIICEDLSAQEESVLQTENVSHQREKVQNSEPNSKESGEKNCEKEVEICDESLEIKDETPLAKMFDFEKGVIFYLKNDIVVGIVLWNVFNRMSVARQVLARDTKYDEITEISKWFTIHED